MAVTAPSYEPIASAVTRPSLVIVPDQPRAASDHDAEMEAAVWHSAAVGAVIGFFVCTVAITMIGAVGGIGAVNAFGIGFFAGAFSGVGFGFMMGASIALARAAQATVRP